MSRELYEVERQEAHRFLASIGLCLKDNHIWRLPSLPGDYPLTGSETSTVQTLWDTEWDRIKPAIEAQLEVERKAAAVEREAQVQRIEILRAKFGLNEAERKAEAFAQIEAARERRERALPTIEDKQEIKRKRDREHHRVAHFEEMASGFVEHHLYGPRGFKNPFKYEESPDELWAMPNIRLRGRIGGSFSYRPSHPLAENQGLSIVTAGICGDPPKGRSALEARAALHA